MTAHERALAAGLNRGTVASQEGRALSPLTAIYDDNEYRPEDEDCDDLGLPVDLRVVAVDDENPCPYRPSVQAANALAALIIRNSSGDVVSDGHPSLKLLALLRAYFYAVQFSNGEVYLTDRTSYDPPTGGVCRPLLDDHLINRCIARYNRTFPRAALPNESTVRTALRSLGGEALHALTAPWVRWGRSADGALWWDSGDDKFVRVDASGWTVSDSADCWFARSEAIRPIPLPVTGGSLDALWDFAPVNEADRPLVVAWMLAATHPDRETAAGMLYISGPEGSAKSTSADKITEACGSSVARKKFDTRRGDDRDLIVGARASWVLGLDNLSTLTAEQQDLLCTIVTGHEETYRVLHTTTATVTLSVRRPVTLTSIEVPILRPDLISRMVPVTLDALECMIPEDELAVAWRSAQPRVFGALLDLLVKVLATPRQTSEHMPRLASLGRLALAADLVTGTRTLGRLAEAQTALLGDTVADDPFYDTLARCITCTWRGSASALLAKIDPDGTLARQHGRQWPTAKGVSARLKRSRRALELGGWGLAVNHAGHHGQVWTITPPPV